MNTDTHHSTKELTPRQQAAHRREAASRLRFAAAHDQAAVLAALGTAPEGLSKTQVAAARGKYGDNRLTHGRKESAFIRLLQAFASPFTAILFLLAAVSIVTDILWAGPGEANPVTVLIIVSMVMLSGVLRFVQETRSGSAAEKLLGMIHTTTRVERRETGPEEIPLADVVVGDIVHLSAGDMLPADALILKAKDLFVSQAALTGESEPVEKTAGETKAGPAESAEEAQADAPVSLADCPHLAFMGSNVVSGTALAVAVVTGNDTLFGEMARSLHAKPVKTSFEQGINTVSWVLIRFMLIMVPVVFLLNGVTKHNWTEAFLFAISVAVGLTPQMLPMIVTTCLAKGALSMAGKKTIIKKLDAIQNLGSMDILCTDKTGTLTQDKVVLQRHFNIQGEEDVRVLRHAFLNSYFQTGLKNLMDIAVIARTHEEEASEPTLQGLTARYKKVDEVPFDFERRRMSVVVEEANGETQIITKGAVEEMLSICAYAEYRGRVEPISGEIRRVILDKAERLNGSGMRVIGLAHKTTHAPAGAFSKADECDMVFMGYLAFLDPPKDSAAKAVMALKAAGVAVKVLTGDNDKVTRAICKHIGLDVNTILLGPDIAAMDDDALAGAAEAVAVFAKLAPQQKARIIAALRRKGHSVGYMGDGINDTAAMKAADVAISVDTAVDIAKESSSIILLEKSLMVLESGIIEGRKTYANMIKYIKITASSNFGNVFSVLAASAFLPFMPMLSLQLILLNLIYDLSCTSIPWDNVDKEYVNAPRKWNSSNLGRFMVWMGPTSSIFDMTTFCFLYFVICPAAVDGLLFHQITDPSARAHAIALFQTGWFIESMWTQTLVIHMLRTPKIPFLQSRASFQVIAMTVTGITALSVLPFTAPGRAMGLTALPAAYFHWLAITILAYMLLATLVKHCFIRRYGELL